MGRYSISKIFEIKKEEEKMKRKEKKNKRKKKKNKREIKEYNFLPQRTGLEICNLEWPANFSTMMFLHVDVPLC